MRPLALLGALLLSACSTDVFVGADGATGDGGTSDGAISDGGGMPDAFVKVEVKCNSSTCQATQTVCCTGSTWDLASCAAPSSENTISCQHYLECDDITDCAGGQVCCAQQIFDNTLAKNVVTTSRCSSTCGGSTSSVQLCDSDNECKTGSCQNYAGSPSWLKTCQ